MGLITSFTLILHQFTGKLQYIYNLDFIYLALTIGSSGSDHSVLNKLTAEIWEEDKNKPNKYEQPHNQKGCKQANSLCRYSKPFYSDL